MGSDSGRRGYDLTEIFAIKFVLADVVIIAALLFAGPIYAVAITALLVLSVFLVWYLTERVGSGSSAAEETTADRAPAGAVESAAETDADPDSARDLDPVTRLQHRYADGELSDAEFEAKLERVIDANERAERAGVDTAELSLERSELTE